MEDRYLRIHNPDPKGMSIRFMDSVIIIPAHDSVVVSYLVGSQLQSLYAHLEVVPAALQEYQAYRSKRDALDKAEAIARAAEEAAMAQSALDAKQAEIAHQQMLADKAKADAEAATARHEALIAEEKAVIETVDKNTARTVSTGSLPPSMITPGMQEAKV